MNAVWFSEHEEGIWPVHGCHVNELGAAVWGSPCQRVHRLAKRDFSTVCDLQLKYTVQFRTKSANAKGSE